MVTMLAMYEACSETIETIAILSNRLNGILNKVYTRVIFYVRREVDLMKMAKVNAYIMHIFEKIELLSIHAA